LDTSDCTRGDSAAQTAALQAGVTGGWLSPNEARAELGLNPGGPELDVYRVAVNLMNADLLVDQKAPETNPVPEPVVDKQEDEPSDAARSYLPLFRDAVTRVLAGETATRAFGPCTEALASSKGLTDPQVLVNVLQAVEKRSTGFTAENCEQMAEETLTRVYRAVIHAAHEAAARKELGE